MPQVTWPSGAASASTAPAARSVETSAATAIPRISLMKIAPGAERQFLSLRSGGPDECRHIGTLSSVHVVRAWKTSDRSPPQRHEDEGRRVRLRRLAVGPEHRPGLETSRPQQALELVLRIPAQQPEPLERLNDRAVLDHLVAQGGHPEL